MVVGVDAGAIAVDEHVVQQEVVDAAVKKQKNFKQNIDVTQQTIRVNSSKLESLVNLVGELVIGSANSNLNARRLADADLNEAMEKIKQNSRRYAKRQITWFKKHGNWKAFHPDLRKDILKYIEGQLEI